MQVLSEEEPDTAPQDSVRFLFRTYLPVMFTRTLRKSGPTPVAGFMRTWMVASGAILFARLQARVALSWASFLVAAVVLTPDVNPVHTTELTSLNKRVFLDIQSFALAVSFALSAAKLLKRATLVMVTTSAVVVTGALQPELDPEELAAASTVRPMLVIKPAVTSTAVWSPTGKPAGTSAWPAKVPLPSVVKVPSSVGVDSKTSSPGVLLAKPLAAAPRTPPLLTTRTPLGLTLAG